MRVNLGSLGLLGPICPIRSEFAFNKVCFFSMLRSERPYFTQYTEMVKDLDSGARFSGFGSWLSYKVTLDRLLKLSELCI